MSFPLLAQVSVDPDYEIELQQNTECSFITGNSVNIRSGPSLGSPVVTQLNRGDGVRAQYRQGDWVKLAARVYGFPPNETFEPLDGWVFNQYINGCSEDQFDRWRQISVNEEQVNERLAALFGDPQPYRDFFFKLQHVVRQDQRTEVAKLVQYPLTVNTASGSSQTIRNSRQFLRSYDSIITPGVEAAISQQQYEDLFARDQGVMIANGVIWFSGICQDNSCQSQVVKVITINQNALT